MKNQCILIISQSGNAPVLVKNDIIKFAIELCKFNFLRASIVSSHGRQSKAFLKSTDRKDIYFVSCCKFLIIVKRSCKADSVDLPSINTNCVGKYGCIQ